MSLRDRLAAITGVWEGTYTHFTPGGERLDHFQSRQETRLEGDRWYERIIYRWADGREQVLDFRARFSADGERLLFDDPDFEGVSIPVGDDMFVFPYRWKDRPGERVVETIVLSGPSSRARLWQTFAGEELRRITVIVERRVAGSPAVWH
jgi:Domain of unknown function (DUF3598), N-terminal